MQILPFKLFLKMAALHAIVVKWFIFCGVIQKQCQ